MSLDRNIYIRNAIIVNENRTFTGNVLVKGDLIVKISENPICEQDISDDCFVYDAKGVDYLFPGIIDTHVHFREPGYTHKGTFATESKAALAGGVTSIVDMPNTKPPAISLSEINEKEHLASLKCHTNFGFHIAATNDNINELLLLENTAVCGIKLFMGSSTGNMLVDKEESLIKLFSNAKLPIVAHCEDEALIKKAENIHKGLFSENILPKHHLQIRSREACIKSTSKAIELAKKFNTRLHILHLSTEDELQLFDNFSVEEKKITAEVCINHLWFDETAYDSLGNSIKCNPSIKLKSDKLALQHALSKGIIDVISTDHAPHTISEKAQQYFQCPSGIPSIQYSLLIGLELVKNRVLCLETLIAKMCHNPAKLFNIKKRGFIKEGFYADFTIVKPNERTVAMHKNVHSLCSWTPYHNYEFSNKIILTVVNGVIKYNNCNFYDDSINGRPLEYVR